MLSKAQSWGNAVFRYNQAQFKPKQMEEAVKNLPDALQPKTPVEIELSSKNGMDTATILNAYPEGFRQRNAVLQGGKGQGSTSGFLKAALKLFQSIRATPSGKSAHIAPPLARDSFHTALWEKKVQHADPRHSD